MTGRYREAAGRLSSAQKPAYGAPAYSRFVNRPAGRRIAALAYAARLTPNAVTGISAVLSAAAVACLALLPIGTGTGVLVAALLALGYAFDAADGQLARLTGTGGPGGEWLDHVVDMAKTVLVHGTVAVSLVAHTAAVPTWQVAAVVGFATVNVVSFFGWLLAELLQRISPPAVHSHPRASGKAPLLRSLLRLPNDYGALLWIFVLWGITLFWWAYLLLFAANVVILAAAMPVWYRQARESGRPRST